MGLDLGDEGGRQPEAKAGAEIKSACGPHVLIFPLPVQGHVNSMLKLAELLCLSAGSRIKQVAFLNSDYNHHRLLRFTDVQTRFARFPGFRFETISDGLHADHPRSGDLLNEMFDSIKALTKPLLRKMLISSSSASGSYTPVTCIIVDGIMSTFTMDVADELRIPVISFRTISACCFWAYCCIPQLISAGELPLRFNDIEDDDNYMDGRTTSLPGMESFLRRRDLPSFCRAKDLSDPLLQCVITETCNTISRASALILNTFEELEGPILSHIRAHCPGSTKVYSIGPLHAHLKARQQQQREKLSDQADESKCATSTSRTTTKTNSLWEEDRSCMTWLDSKPLRSVVYVSFGSLAVMSRKEMLEFWHGLVNCGKYFLWVIRPDSIKKAAVSEIPDSTTSTDDDQTDQLDPILRFMSNIGTRARGFVVGWVPQEEVLAHPAVGGVSDPQWMELDVGEYCGGCPMICWPYVWKVGLDMKDRCERRFVESMVNNLTSTMEVHQKLLQREDTGDSELSFLGRKVNKFADLARSSIVEGGSPYMNFDCLIDHIVRTASVYIAAVGIESVALELHLSIPAVGTESVTSFILSSDGGD
ncbi:hypothetical protein MKX01_007361 [Papaver californicum]|nr:hypothetical protein MKX01_007361 [Papaver californicum]